MDITFVSMVTADLFASAKRLDSASVGGEHNLPLDGQTLEGVWLQRTYSVHREEDLNINNFDSTN